MDAPANEQPQTTLTGGQIDIIKATAPVVAEHALDITNTFYPLMFEAYPQVRQVFNQSHQAGGSQPQALANSIIAYATHIENPGVLAPALETIVQKHVSLNITPPQYAIVGECLMAAIGKVLGSAVTADVADAWGAAYWQLANLLIKAEEAEYRRKAQMKGGWRGARRVRIARKERESAVITSFYLEPVDRLPLMAFEAGQYLGVKLTVDGQVMHRNYSLSHSPDPNFYRISVKREPNGVASGFLHDRAQIGDELEIYPPAGNFTLKPGTGPVVLLTGGVGQTPAVPMLDAALGQGRDVIYLHAALNGDMHAFRNHVDGVASNDNRVTHAYIYSEPNDGDQPHHKGLVTTEILERYLPASLEADVYFLGPKPFMQGVWRDLNTLGVSADRISYEFFGPLEALA